MAIPPSLRSVSMEELETRSPRTHRQLLEFCSELDPQKYPEATIIVDGKTKTLAPFGKLYARMKTEAGKKNAEKTMARRLKNAENMMITMNALKTEHSGTGSHRIDKDTASSNHRGANNIKWGRHAKSDNYPLYGSSLGEVKGQHREQDRKVRYATVIALARERVDAYLNERLERLGPSARNDPRIVDFTLKIERVDRRREYATVSSKQLGSDAWGILSKPLFVKDMDPKAGTLTLIDWRDKTIILRIGEPAAPVGSGKFKLGLEAVRRHDEDATKPPRHGW